jgi:hypothetical protein
MWTAFARSQYERVSERHASGVTDEYLFDRLRDSTSCRRMDELRAIGKSRGSTNFCPQTI